jgi:hypothetical protein
LCQQQSLNRNWYGFFYSRNYDYFLGMQYSLCVNCGMKLFCGLNVCLPDLEPVTGM